ncbi:glycosyl hydrolase family 79 C-terminal domain-containing protein [Chitinophaga sp.]|uniref:glycosyl hydrolase family 79 C-terminal domain-containing protein n=1 Tax=Chitinophaga sp. TaxID=1869181 RepID=UPI002F944FA6
MKQSNVFHIKTSAKVVLVACAIALASACSKPVTSQNTPGIPEPVPDGILVSVDIDAAHPGMAIPDRFTGFSFSAEGLANGDYLNPANTGFVNLLKALGPGVIRTGGHVVDGIRWIGPAGKPVAGTVTMNGWQLDNLFNFARACGYKVLLGLNLGTGLPEESASEARYACDKGKDVLLGFEIGNEPNGFNHNGLRPSNYKYPQFLLEYNAHRDKILEWVPAAPLTGPGTSTPNIDAWVKPFIVDQSGKLVVLTKHYYKLGPPEDPAVTIEALLKDNVAVLGQADAMTMNAGKLNIPWRFSEINSVYEGGKVGVSNTFGSALWGLDMMFELAKKGCGGVNFHTGGASYTPITRKQSLFSGRPLYYGMLAFAQASKGRLLSTDLTTDSTINLTCHAVLQSDNAMVVTLINKDLKKDGFVTINAHTAYSKATLMRLMALSPDTESNVTLGGSAVKADGTWEPKEIEVAYISSNVCKLKVPACSAVILTLK